MKRKVIDIDQIFDDFLVSYINENRGKFSEKEWEEKIVNLYHIFLETPIDELGGVTPDKYYDGATAEELCELLCEHVRTEVSVPDSLCHALLNCDSEKLLASLVNSESSEELVCYAINILSEKKSTAAFDSYFELLLSNETSENLKELCAESLSDFANEAKETALKLYKQAGSSAIYLLEIFARCDRDDRVFNILIEELKAHNGDALYLSYVSKYGDERALPYLLEIIDNPNIGYSDFKELKLAIECFGGEYTEQRDFSNDKAFMMTTRRKKDEGDCS